MSRGGETWQASINLLMYNWWVISLEEHSSADGRPIWKFYYDGDCGLCCGAVKWLDRLDFDCRIAWIPFQSLEEPPDNLSWEGLDRSAYLVAGKGGRHEGFYAFRKLTLKMPSLWPLAFIFWIPGIQAPGRVIYRWIAVNRYRLSRCGISDGMREPDSVSRATPNDDC